MKRLVMLLMAVLVVGCSKDASGPSTSNIDIIGQYDMVGVNDTLLPYHNWTAGTLSVEEGWVRWLITDKRYVGTIGVVGRYERVDNAHIRMFLQTSQTDTVEVVAKVSRQFVEFIYLQSIRVVFSRRP